MLLSPRRIESQWREDDDDPPHVKCQACENVSTSAVLRERGSSRPCSGWVAVTDRVDRSRKAASSHATFRTLSQARPALEPGLLPFSIIRSLPLAWKFIAVAWASVGVVILLIYAQSLGRFSDVLGILLVLASMVSVLASMTGAVMGFGGPQVRIGAVLVGLVIPVIAGLLVVGIALLSQGAG